MKKALAWGMVAVVVAGLGGWVGYEAYRRTHEEDAVAVKKKVTIAVEANLPEKRSIQDARTFTGTLKPWSLFEVAPKVGGRLEEINFDIGDRIVGGSLIARIDETEYRQAFEQAEADLEVVRAKLQEAAVMVDLRRSEFDRQKSLMEKDATTKAQYESAETAFRAQEAAFRQCQAEVKRGAAVLENARLKLQDCTISAAWAPEGRPRFVGTRSVDQGALLSPNQPILSVAELDRLLAVIYVIERDYPYLRHEQEAVLSTDAYPKETFKGKVVRIAQVLQDSTRQAAVQLEIPNGDYKLKPGMYVRVTLEFASRQNATVVPRSALVKRDGRPGVFLLNAAEETASFVPVETGITSGDQIEILSPVLDRPVITLGNHLLTDGVEVLVPAKFRTGAKDGADRTGTEASEAKGE